METSLCKIQGLYDARKKELESEEHMKQIGMYIINVVTN